MKLVALLTLCILTSCGGTPAPIGQGGRVALPKAEEGPPELIVIGGALRPDANGDWYIIEDVFHKPLNLDSVTVKDGVLVVGYTGCGTIITAMVDPDESLAAEGITAGVSVGMNTSNIFLFQAGLTVDPATLTTAVVGSSANLWFRLICYT